MKIPDQLLLRLDKEAKIRRVPRSRLIRESLETTFENLKPAKQLSAYDLAADLIRGPRAKHKDLVTNPKYMEGFGE